MRALLCQALDGPKGLERADIDPPEPGACHVRIDVAAAGINFADLLMLEGRYQERPALPFIPGLEVAGRVEKVGAGINGLDPGERVLALLDHGGFAEQAVARADDVIAIPETLDGDAFDDVTAAGFAIVYGTAEGALAWRAQLHAGETLLVHGAAGGVGLATVECGKAMGATVIATARGDDRLALAREHGADHGVDADHPDLAGEIRRLTGGRGVDVVVDPVGGALFEASLKAIAWEGRIVSLGFASGTIPKVPANILLVKNAAVLGFFWGSYRREDPARLRASFHRLFAWLEAGKLRPHVSAVLPLEAAADGLERLRQRKSTGKVVVRL